MGKYKWGKRLSKSTGCVRVDTLLAQTHNQINIIMIMVASNDYTPIRSRFAL